MTSWWGKNGASRLPQTHGVEVVREEVNCNMAIAERIRDEPSGILSKKIILIGMRETEGMEEWRP